MRSSSVNASPIEIGSPFCGSSFADSYYEINITFSSMLDDSLNRNLFNSEVLVTSDITGSNVVENGEVIGEVSTGFSFGSGLAYYIEDQSKSIALNDLLAGDTVEVVYEVTMRSSSVNASPTEPVYIDDYLISSAPFANAAFGDPSGLSGPATASTSFRAAPATVSAPGNLLILGLGISALAFARKRKAK
jgi:hypothetical protein